MSSELRSQARFPGLPPGAAHYESFYVKANDPPHRGLTNVYGTAIEETATECKFTLPGKEINVKGTVGAEAGRFIGWVYADPAGREHNALNCSIGDIDLRIERPSHRHAKFRCEGTATYELGTEPGAHQIPLQPYGDG